MTTRPRLAAVEQWLASDRSGPIEWPAEEKYRDPSEWRDPARRIEAVIRQCASGAPAFDTVTLVVEEVVSGRHLPLPPTTATKENP